MSCLKSHISSFSIYSFSARFYRPVQRWYRWDNMASWYISPGSLLAWNFFAFLAIAIGQRPRLIIIKGCLELCRCLKTVTDASTESFSQMKVFFTHTAGTKCSFPEHTKLVTTKYLDKTVYLQSFRSEHEGKVYKFWLEQRLHVTASIWKLTERLINIIFLC